MTGKGTWIYILDLDGTLVAGNSYHQLLRRLLVPIGRTQPRPRLATCVRTWRLVVLRGLGLIDRCTCKMRLQQLLASSSDAAFMTQFARDVRARVRSEMQDIIVKARAAGVPLVLATGALAEYAIPLARELGFDIAVCTTVRRDGVWVETIREAKADSVLAAIDRAGLGSLGRVCFADHDDDAVLAEQCDVRFWVGKHADRLLESRRDSTRDRPLAAFDEWCREQHSVTASRASTNRLGNTCDNQPLSGTRGRQR